MGTIAIASDHAGYELKQAIIEQLKVQRIPFNDLGCDSPDPVDYPDLAHALCELVENGSHQRGILVCATGIGMSITANRYPGIRAAVCHSPEFARLARQHNDANVLCLAGRNTDLHDFPEILKAWLETPFEGGRHARRVEKINR